MGILYLDTYSYELEIPLDDRKLLTKISQIIATSIKKSFSYQKNIQNWKDWEKLVDIGKAINSVLNLDGLLILIMDTVIKVTSAERGFLMLENGGILKYKIENSNNF